MGKDAFRSSTRGALQEDPSPVDEFDGSATIVDPDAGRRAMAAIAAARGLGQNDVPTKESKNVSAALAAHERNLAEERQVSSHPTPAVGFDLRVDALQEIESPGLTLKPSPLPAPPLPALREEVPEDKFDIDVATGSSLSTLPRKPASRGLTLVALALIAAASGFAAFHFVGARLGLGRPAPPTASAR